MYLAPIQNFNNNNIININNNDDSIKFNEFS